MTTSCVPGSANYAQCLLGTLDSGIKQAQTEGAKYKKCAPLAKDLSNPVNEGLWQKCVDMVNCEDSASAKEKAACKPFKATLGDKGYCDCLHKAEAIMKAHPPSAFNVWEVALLFPASGAMMYALTPIGSRLMYGNMAWMYWVSYVFGTGMMYYYFSKA